MCEVCSMNVLATLRSELLGFLTLRFKALALRYSSEDLCA